ncbi:hypothetical protein NZK33_06930 [Cyanobium sp. FGCU-6]|nr:hypothetical protein [Cyanobium sp. FGCU6]
MPPPTTVHADQLQGPLGRLTSAELTAIAASVIQAFDLQGLEPWQLDPEASGAAGGTAALGCHLGYQICSAAASVESTNDSRRLWRQGKTANSRDPTANRQSQETASVEGLMDEALREGSWGRQTTRKPTLLFQEPPWQAVLEPEESEGMGRGAHRGAQPANRHPRHLDRVLIKHHDARHTIRRDP